MYTCPRSCGFVSIFSSESVNNVVILFRRSIANPIKCANSRRPAHYRTASFMLSTDCSLRTTHAKSIAHMNNDCSTSNETVAGKRFRIVAATSMRCCSVGNGHCAETFNNMVGDKGHSDTYSPDTVVSNHLIVWVAKLSGNFTGYLEQKIYVVDRFSYGMGQCRRPHVVLFHCSALFTLPLWWQISAGYEVFAGSYAHVQGTA